jgi:drug/metabolite transporter (DMT)-like permease
MRGVRACRYDFGHAARYGWSVAHQIQFIGHDVGLAARRPATSWTARAAAAPSIAYVGVLSSALTFTLLAVSLKHTSTAEATIIVSLETVIAAIAGAVMLGERLSPLAMSGAALILAAVIQVQLAAQSARNAVAAPAR